MTLQATRSMGVDQAGGTRRRATLLLPAAATFAPVVGLAAAQGGYFPTSWGWASVPLFWTAAVCLTVRADVRLSRAETVFLVALAAFAAWLAISVLWSSAPAESVLEVERALVYSAAGAAVLLTARARSITQVLGALLAAISVISAFSLATRLLPDRVGIYDGSGVYRLAQPVGYWNGLALFAAIGTLLALGFAARARAIGMRAACAALLLLLLPTLYFTFGRAAWIALAGGLLAAIALDPRRAQLLATLLVVGPAPAAALFLASREHGLTHGGSTLAVATHDGHRLAFMLALLAVANAGAAGLLALVERRVRVGRIVQRVFVLAVAAVALGATTSVVIHYGGPVQVVEKAYKSFRAPLQASESDLNSRLGSFSGNGRAELWGLAWDDAGSHPLLGAGAGTYERYFLRHQPADVSLVRDAHSLYLETLAEIGPVGLALLVLLLATPLAVVRGARAHPLVPAAAGAYVAYLVHTAVDWDWELPAVTLAGLLCGASILLVSRTSTSPAVPPRLRWGLAGAAVAVALFATVALIGNTALSRSATALRHGDLSVAAEDARRARVLLPWSPAPLEALGQAQLAGGALPEARRSFRRAISMDDGDWALWYDLSRVTSGSERSRSLDQVARLFPRSGLLPSKASSP